MRETIGKVQYATTPKRNYEADQQTRAAARREVEDLIVRRGWQVKSTAPARQLLAEAIAALHALGQDDLLTKLDDYAEAAEMIASSDLTAIRRRGNLESMVEGVAIGTVLGDVLLAALRRLAQENENASTPPAFEGAAASRL